MIHLHLFSFIKIVLRNTFVTFYVPQEANKYYLSIKKIKKTKKQR